MTKTIIFDFGDTLVNDTVRTFAEKYGIGDMPKKRRDFYWNSVELSELGKISTRQLLKNIQEIVPRLSLSEIEHHMTHPKALPTYRLLLRLKKHYQIIILSDNHKTWPQKVIKNLRLNLTRIPFVNSAEVGLKKPDPKFFKYALKKYHLKPQETIFVDNEPAYIKTARSLKLQAFCYKNNPKTLKQFLKKHQVTQF